MAACRNSECATRKPEELMKRGKWEFEGSVEKKLSRRYVGKSVRKYVPMYAQTPVRFFGC